jgi:hypothetical protein
MAAILFQVEQEQVSEYNFKLHMGGDSINHSFFLFIQGILKITPLLSILFY